MRIKRLWFTLLIALMMFSIVAITSAASVADAEVSKTFDLVTIVDSSAALSDGVIQNTDDGVAIDFTLKIVNNPGVNMISLRLNFDAAKLNVVGYSVNSEVFDEDAGDFAGVKFDNEKGTVTIDFMTADFSEISNSDCDLVTLNCKLNGSFDGIFSDDDFYIRACDAIDDTWNPVVDNVEQVESFKAHHYVAVEGSVQAPSCITPGTTDFKCSKCDDKITVTTADMAGHTPVVDEAVTPTCTKTGLTEGSHCEVCGEVIVAQVEIPVDPKAHTPGEKVIENSKAEECEVSGSYEEVVYCTECEAEIERKFVEVPAKGHTPGETVKENEVAPTCTADGSYDEVVRCTTCNEVLSSVTKVVDKLGHTSAAEAVKENVVDPTCTLEGSYDNVFKCTVCGEDFSREKVTVPALGHTPVDDAKVDPTCTDAGKTAGQHCSVCNEVLVAQIDIPALGHTFGEWVETVKPTTTAKGEKVKTCSVCNATEKEEIPKLPVISASATEWKKGNDPLVFTSDAAFADFINVTVNGETLAEGADYTVAEGSTVVTLTEEYLKSLEKGGYEISINSTNGSAKITFVVQSSNALWIVLIVIGAVLVCGVVAAYVVIYLRKKRNNA